MIPDLLDIATLRAGFAAGAFTPGELVDAVYDRIEAYRDPAVFIALRPRAAARDEAMAADPSLPLAGLPFAVKDNIDVAGMPTTAGCPAFAYMPARDAAVVARLRAAGAVPIGKTNLDQFATGLNGTRSPHGAPRCVFDARYVSGGSSSGSAVAVAAGLAVFSLGTDTAGSGRVPASFNNLVGLKPTRGLLPASGVVPACRSLDCVSVFANAAADAATVLAAAQGVDAEDPYSRAPETVALPERPRVGILGAAERIGGNEAGYAALYARSCAVAEGLGWTLVEIDDAPFRAAASLLYEDAFVAERLSALRGFFAQSPEAFDPAVRAILERARGFDAADLFDAQARLMGLRRQAGAELAKVDALLLPTAPEIFTVAAMLEAPIALNAALGRYTNFVNLLDMAAVAVPAGFRADGLPFGVSLIGPAFSDAALLALGDALHRAGSPGCGVSRRAAPGALAMPEAARISIVVAGAHLSGMALNHELTALGARLEEATTTAADYRLYALATAPAKPGLVRAPGFAGPGIAVERWSLSPAEFGRFVAGVPGPMTIGQVTLADGRRFAGFLCEPAALEGAREITGFGGWRAYLAAA